MVASSASKVEVSWNDILTGNLPASSTAAQTYRNTVIEVAAGAKAALGGLNGRVDKARDLVLAGLVTRQADYSFQVRSESSKGRAYVVSPDGHCDCPDAQKPDKRCKHLLATWIWRKARAQVEAQAAPVEVDGAEDAPAATGVVISPAKAAVNGATPAPAPASTSSTPPPAPTAAVPEVTMPTGQVPAWALVEIHGKQHITYGGLLAMAHERGLTSLSAQFVQAGGSATCSESPSPSPTRADTGVYPYPATRVYPARTPDEDCTTCR